MHTTPKHLIERYTRAGWWGNHTISDIFDQSAARHSERVALIDPLNRDTLTDGATQQLTWSALADRVQGLTAAFYAAGLRRDDRVVVQLPNIAELPISYLALLRLGVIVSPVPMQYGPHELRQAIQKLSPSAYVTVSRWKQVRHAARNAPVFAKHCPVLAFGEEPPVDAISLSLESAISVESSRQYTEHLTLSANDIATICWTSGTTGQPKGVPRSHNHWIVSGYSSADTAGVHSADVLLSPFPLVNMASLGGFFLPWLSNGNTLVLHHPFDSRVYLEQLELHRVTYTVAAPAVLNMLLNQPELLDRADLSHLRAIGSGGAPLTEWMVATFQQKYGIYVINVFGSNEGLCLSSGPADLPNPADRARYFPHYGFQGAVWKSRVSAMTHTRIVDMETREEIHTPGTPGELEISGPTVFDGYWESEEDNQNVFSEDGYFRSGDIFEIPSDPQKASYFAFVGRSKDIIVRGGVKISPSEIDSLLAAHPKVAAAAVAGYEDDILGERIGVAVVAKPGETVALDDITDFLRQQGVATFKLPERICSVDALPTNPSGKIMRRSLKVLFEG